MVCNIVDYTKMIHRLFYGVGLTDERMTAAHKEIAAYLREGGCAELASKLGLVCVIWENVDGEMTRFRMAISRDNRAPEILTISEIEAIGAYLPGGWRKAE